MPHTLPSLGTENCSTRINATKLVQTQHTFIFINPYLDVMYLEHGEMPGILVSDSPAVMTWQVDLKRQTGHIITQGERTPCVLC